MRYISIESVEPGQYLGRTIFSSNGTVLLSQGVQLTVYMITTLKRVGVTMIYIKDPVLEDVEITDVISEETKRSVMKRMTEIFDTVRSGKEFDTRHINGNINHLIEEVMNNKEVLIQLSDIRTKDNEQFVHALNVCMMSTMIGVNMSLNQSQLKDLAIGALLHDVGKSDLGCDDASGNLKNHHTWHGFEILKNKREFSLLAAHVAFQHHEAIDGTGMPRNLTGENIHLYAKIVTVANIYDNLLNELSDKRPMLPHEACEHMMALSGTKIDHEVLIHFLRTVSVYPTGTSVRLSNKETGVVVGQHRGLPGRPIVRVIERESENELSVKEIDLAKHTTLFIDAVLI